MDSLSNITIYTERLVLKSITIEDCSDKYVSWLNDVDVNKYLEFSFQKQDMDELILFVNSVAQKPNVVFLSIRLKLNNKHIGNIKIDKISQNHLTGEYGIMMGDKSEWGNGYAKEASIAIIDFCFNKLKLQKLNLGVINGNTHAIKLYESLGFVTEGIIRKNFYEKVSKCWEDEIRMGLINIESKFYNQ
jgi:ribosomal-protein-alanine N-acetyltransferase